MIPRIFSEVKYESTQRFDLNRPFVRNGWLYATDGSILVRRPIEGIEAEIPEDWRQPGRRLPNAEIIFAGLRFDDAIAIDLPDVPEKVPCDECRGSGEVDYVQDEHLEVRQKLTRKGKPVFIDCENCDGTGTLYNTDPVKVCELPVFYLMGRYVGLLRRHGVTTARISTNEIRNGFGNPPTSRVVAFEVDGFSGLLMPMDPAGVEADLRRQAS